jgi:beta-N-acetylhexosaminidase
MHDQLASHILLWFEGTTPPAALLELLRREPVGGVTLFRHINSAPPNELRALTAALQAAARAWGQPPLLICADQEGGQLQALPGLTAFPGAMALGATGDADLARRVGAAQGAELAALGVNVNYAPVCDVNSDPENPVIGGRAFGADPALTARLAAATVEGLQSAGVAATAKHFPGHGDTAADSHHGLPTIPHERARLEAVEFPPFRAAIAAGAHLVMGAHLALPALTGDTTLPATRSRAIMQTLLRDELGFAGVTVSDALNMGGFAPAGDLDTAIVAAVAAGVDLLLLAEPLKAEPTIALLRAALADGRLDRAHVRAAQARINRLKQWVAAFPQPDLSVVGCTAHQSLARETAQRAITLVRDAAGRLPLRPAADARLAVITPALVDLTPADTSSYERCELADAVRAYHGTTTEYTVPADPSPAEVAALAERLSGYDLVIAGTINAVAQPGQAALVNELLRREVPLVAVALRLPTDLAAYPAAPTYLCSYSILRPAMDALAAALWGRAPITGRLPATIPGHYQ